MLRIVISCVMMLIVIQQTSAATYYVDYQDGSDSNTGLSPAEAFKHCPDSTPAAGNAASTILKSGDKVIFKGGVSYLATIQIKRSGAEGNPIIYDGNTQGTFGQGKAIIDGANYVPDWTACESQAACGDNPNWQNIYYALIPPPGDSLFVTNLCQGDRYMGIAQDPNPSDLFFQDRTNTYRTIVSPIPAKVGNQMEYVDATYFTQPGADYFGDDAYFAIWAGSNRIFYLKLYQYDPANHKVYFEVLNDSQYAAGRGKFCMFNGIRLIDQPGEYYVKLTPETSGQHKIYCYPYDNDTSEMYISKRADGFSFLAGKYITIQGFIVKRQSDGYRNAGINDSASGVLSNIIIKDNEIRLVRNLNEVGRRSAAIRLYGASNCLIDNNIIDENLGSIGFLLDGYDDSVTSNNYLRKCGSTAVDYYGCERSTLMYNTLVDNKAVHANGLTLYLGCKDILVEGNHVTGGNVSLTAQDGENFIIRNNFFRYGGTSGNDIAFWTISTTSNVSVINNTLGGKIYGQNAGGASNVVEIKNNICSGLSGTLPGTRSHNLYTASPGVTLGPGSIIETNLSKVFKNHVAGDFTLADNSPAIDAADSAVAPPLDFDQKHRPIGSGYDIGAYEYGAEGAYALASYIFYNNSAFDGNDPQPNAADDQAIATDKQPLLSGQTATFSNYTSYDSGINGLMIDVMNLPEGELTADDFEFYAGIHSSVSLWDPAPLPTSISIRRGEGVNGSDRITLIWPDRVIAKTWLKVTVKTNANTGFVLPYTFYFGNAPGETGDQPSNAKVDATDAIECRNNPRHFLKPAAIDSVWDHNRDGKVDASDEIISRNNVTNYMTEIVLITAP